MSILDATTNVIELYLHCCGKSEIPDVFHEWTIVSMIAACAANRVHYRKMADQRLTPNLYVMLIGPSGAGKGEAINTMLSLTRGTPNLAIYPGRITAQGLYDLLRESPRTYLITPELANDIGDGSVADAFMKTITDLYTGTPLGWVGERTRTKGKRLLEHHCLNWLGGTTRRWLLETVKPSAVTEGAFGRIVSVFGQRGEQRHRRPIYPRDRDLIVDHLRQRVLELCHIEGAFTMTGEAEDVEEHWYNNRLQPVDENLQAFWQRQHDLTLKLAMIFSLADDLDLEIQRHHMIAAQQWSDSAMRNMPALISAATTSPESTGIEEVVKLIRAYKTIRHSKLLQLVYRKGVDAEKLRPMILTLEQAGLIASGTASPRSYTWVGGRKLE